MSQPCEPRPDLSYCAEKLGDAVDILDSADGPLRERVLRACREARHASCYLPGDLRPMYLAMQDQVTAEPAIKDEGILVQTIGVMSEEALAECARTIRRLYKRVIRRRELEDRQM